MAGVAQKDAAGRYSHAMVIGDSLISFTDIPAGAEVRHQF
jgi:hypothetical protein